MAKLERIWINSFDGGYELRIDWDNDRHQMVALKTLNPDDVKQAFLDMAHFIGQEQRSEHL